MPVSTAGNGTPKMPSTPPNAITSGKMIGSSQSAGSLRTAPHIPTATMAMRWSGPSTGWTKPAKSRPRFRLCGRRRVW
jgi:hypothetical protein